MNSLKFLLYLTLFPIVKSQFNESSEIFRVLIQNGLLRKVGQYVQHGNQLNASDCFRDISFWMDAFPYEKWALKMLDSSGRIPSGLLMTNFQSFGFFDECMEIKHNYRNITKIQGKYCLAKIPIEHFIPSDTLPLHEIFQFPNIKNDFTDTRVSTYDKYRRISLVLGFCMPHTCNGYQIQDVLLEALKNVSIQSEKPFMTISDEECASPDDNTWTEVDWAGLLFFSFFGILVIASTSYELAANYFDKVSNQCHNLLISFSIWTNTLNLVKINRNSTSLTCLHGLRSISILWVIMGHRYVASALAPMMNNLGFFNWIDKLESTAITAATFSVDTFFVIGGLLVSYISFKYLKKDECFNIPLFYLHRFLRLIPAFGAMIFFQVSLFKHLGNGPIWKSFTYQLSNGCEKNWWSAMLFIQNYVAGHNMCLAQTWYLCCDMQYYILSPLLIYPLLRSKRMGWVNVTFWILVSQITIFVLPYLYKWEGSNMGLAGASTKGKNFYYATHTRAIPWLFGFSTGYLLQFTPKSKIVLNKITVSVFWIISLFIMGTVIFGMGPLQRTDHQFSHIEDTVYNAFAKTAWSAAIVWIIIACVYGYGGPVSWFLNLEIWEVLGKLTYSMYLVHFAVEYFHSGVMRSPDYFSNYSMIMMFFSDTVITIIFSYFLAMMFEFPFANLDKIAFSKKNPAMDKQNNFPKMTVKVEKS